MSLQCSSTLGGSVLSSHGGGARGLIPGGDVKLPAGVATLPTVLSAPLSCRTNNTHEMPTRNSQREWSVAVLAIGRDKCRPLMVSRHD